MQSKYWYIPIALILVSTYLVGIYLWFGINFLNFFPYIKDGTGREILSVFLGGIIGGTIYCSYFFGNDANKALGKNAQKGDYPNFIDPFIYILLIIGGGVTAFILVAAVKAGFLMFTETESGTTLKSEAIWVLSIGGGLATHRVKMFLLALVDKTIKKGSKKPDKL